MSELTGKIEAIYETKTYPKKDGTGDLNVTKIRIDGKYFTCFYSKKDIDQMSVGDLVDVNYTEKENEYQGKKFINYNISNIQPHLSDGTKQEKITGKLSGTNTINLGNKTFKITIEEI